MDSIHLKKVEILLNSDQTKYQSGHTISGRVDIVLNGVLDFSRLSIVLRSLSEVNWLEIHGTNYKDGHVFRESEEHLNVVYKIPLSKTKLTAGEHSISFDFKLPDNIPPSIETLHGFIKYWIEAKIEPNNDNSFDQELYRDKKYFIVETPFRHGLHLSVGGGTEKDVALSSSKSGKVRIDASISRKGYVPGETIEVHCLVTNLSTVAVTPRASFIELQIFMAEEYHKTVGASGEPRVCEKVKAGETKDQIITVQIPKDIPLSMKTRLISIKYFIHVMLDIPYSMDLHLNLPIIITNEYVMDERSPSFL